MKQKTNKKQIWKIYETKKQIRNKYEIWSKQWTKYEANVKLILRSTTLISNKYETKKEPIWNKYKELCKTNFKQT